MTQEEVISRIAPDRELQEFDSSLFSDDSPEEAAARNAMRALRDFQDTAPNSMVEAVKKMEAALSVAKPKPVIQYPHSMVEAAKDIKVLLKEMNAHYRISVAPKAAVTNNLLKIFRASRLKSNLEHLSAVCERITRDPSHDLEQASIWIPDNQPHKAA